MKANALQNETTVAPLDLQLEASNRLLTLPQAYIQKLFYVTLQATLYPLKHSSLFLWAPIPHLHLQSNQMDSAFQRKLQSPYPNDWTGKSFDWDYRRLNQ